MATSRFQKAIQQVPTLFSLALPMIFTALLGDASNLSTLFFVGRLNGAKYIGKVYVYVTLANHFNS